jgi:predicted DNA-binding WGR domain protein
MREIILKKINPETNENKLYRLVLPDHSTEVLHQWGRANEWVQEQWANFDDRAAAEKDFAKTEARKRKDGYIDATWAVFPTSYRLYTPGKKQPQPEKQEPKRFIQLNWLDLLRRKRD